MWQTLRDQFPTTFMCVFLAGFLPWILSWQYIDVPILVVQLLMALLFLGPVARDFGVWRSTLFGVLWGLVLLAIGLAVFSIHQTIPPPPVPLFTGLLLLLASASFFVSVIGVVAPLRAKLAAWVLLFLAYWSSGRAVTDEFPLFAGMALVLSAAGWFLLRRYS
jgi:hypothetical protein